MAKDERNPLYQAVTVLEVSSPRPASADCRNLPYIKVFTSENLGWTIVSWRQRDRWMNFTWGTMVPKLTPGKCPRGREQIPMSLKAERQAPVPRVGHRCMLIHEDCFRKRTSWCAARNFLIMWLGKELRREQVGAKWVDYCDLR